MLFLIVVHSSIQHQSETIRRRNYTMTRPNRLSGNRPERLRKSPIHSERKHHSRRSHLRVELLEDRTTPSINPATPLELDGNVITQSSTTHDWDQIFADAGSPTGSGTFTNGATSGALAGSFFTDAVNSNSDDIFTAGGSKDVYGIQQGPWKFTP